MKNKEGKITKRRLKSSYLTSVISISLVLFMLGLIGLLVLNTKKISDYVKENIGFSLIINENVNEAEILKLQKILDTKNYVKSTKYVTKEQAAEELKKELGEDFIGFLGYNPLLASIDVRLIADYTNQDSINVIVEDLKKHESINEMYYEQSLVHLINENVKKIGFFILAFSLLFFLISVTLINNTIRLSVYSKRFIINTMQLVGATRGYIRRPFLRKSTFHGIYAAIIAILFLIGVVYYAEKELYGLIGLQNIKTLGILFGLVLSLGIILSWLSTFFAVNKYLNIHTDYLYH